MTIEAQNPASWVYLPSRHEDINTAATVSRGVSCPVKGNIRGIIFQPDKTIVDSGLSNGAPLEIHINEIDSGEIVRLPEGHVADTGGAVIVEGKQNLDVNAGDALELESTGEQDTASTDVSFLWIIEPT